MQRHRHVYLNNSLQLQTEIVKTSFFFRAHWRCSLKLAQPEFGRARSSVWWTSRERQLVSVRWGLSACRISENLVRWRKRSTSTSFLVTSQLS